MYSFLLLIGSICLPGYVMATELTRATEGTKIANSYIVTLKDDMRFSQISQEEITNIIQGRAESVTTDVHGQLHHVYTNALHGFAAELSEAALTNVLNDSRVERVEEDANIQIDAVGSWGIDRIDGEDLPLDNSYNPTFGNGGEGVTAYVIDTGILASHEEFEGRATQAFNSAGGPNTDCSGHGTHVAGIIGSKTYGVAKKAKLVGVKVMRCTGGGTTSSVIAGIDWVKVNAIKPATANLSLGGGVSIAFNNAIKNLVDSGVPTVVAAGNDNMDACKKSPASEPSAITVASTTITDARSSFSNYGTCVNIYAPGSDIKSTYIGSNTATKTMSGTSMAAPHVCGAVALYLSWDPNLSSLAVTSMLLVDSVLNTISDAGSSKMLFVGRPARPAPTIAPTTRPPSHHPTGTPSSRPSLMPSPSPSGNPSSSPSSLPSKQASNTPSLGPSFSPSFSPSLAPSNMPSNPCDLGHFRNSTGCHICPMGTYHDGTTLATECTKCSPGTFQNRIGATRVEDCIPCANGTFQVLAGQSNCETCRTGGYCSNKSRNSCDGGFNQCPVGTFNDATGADSASACRVCPKGTYSDNKEGLVQCFQCPFRLNSFEGSKLCTICDEGFYLSKISASGEDIFENRDKNCRKCPLNANCPIGTTIETLDTHTGFWRYSNSTTDIHKCNKYSEVCQGGISSSNCTQGSWGILCEQCVEDNHYFNRLEGKCEDCPSLSRLIIFACIITSSAVVIMVATFRIHRFPNIKHHLRKLSNFLTMISLQAKLKVFISFYQMIITLTPIYGVTVHSSFSKWFSFFEYFSFGLVEWLRIPSSCFGSIRGFLWVQSSLPLAFIVLISTIFLFASIFDAKKLGSREAMTKYLSRSFRLTIITVYFVFPSISRSIINTMACQSFTEDDDEEGTPITSKRFLIADKSLECDDSINKYTDLIHTSYMLLTLWGIAVPLLFLGLLLWIRPSVRSNRITPLADACQFLWRDYNSSMMFWDLVDTIRKICLTTLILIVDPEEGTKRIRRLLVAIVICIIYISILSVASPYKRKDDHYFAVVGNLILTCCYVVGILLHQCKEEYDGTEISTCATVIGPTFDSKEATKLAAMLTLGMLVAFLLLIIGLTLNTIRAPAVYLISTKDTPHLDIPADCDDHLFISHVWKTGKDKAHKITRMLQLYVPGLKIWLDTDSLNDISCLEESVAKSVHFILFYSEGYFQSKNCCREVTAAMEDDKPITVIFESDGGIGNEVQKMTEECRQYFSSHGIDHSITISALERNSKKRDYSCNEYTEDDTILQLDKCTQAVVNYIFAKDPVMWLSTGLQFSVESVKMVGGRLLESLPYYRKNARQLVAGLTIINELSPVQPSLPLNILVCDANRGANELAMKLKKECTGKVKIHNINMSPYDVIEQHQGEITVMLLYLNKFTFDQGDLVFECIKHVHNEGIPVILVHEQNINKGWCNFYDIIAQTPTALKVDPFNIYSQDIAINLYPTREYELVSLRTILNKMCDTRIDSPPFYDIFKWLKTVVVKSFLIYQK